MASRLILFFMFGFISLSIVTRLYGEDGKNDGVQESLLNERSIKKVLQDIKQSLPEKMRKCPVVVSKRKLLVNEGKDFIAEDWTITACQETRSYYVTSSTIKGFNASGAQPKEEIYAAQKKMWDAVKKDATKDSWRKVIPYVDEIEENESMQGR